MISINNMFDIDIEDYKQVYKLENGFSVILNFINSKGENNKSVYFMNLGFLLLECVYKISG